MTQAAKHHRPPGKRDAVVASPATSRITTSGDRDKSGLRAAALGMPIHAVTPAALLELQRAAGNQAVGTLLQPVQRQPLDVGWTDASKEGKAWNAGQREVGDIHRIPLEGLAEGLQKEKAATRSGEQSTSIPALSSESAMGKAIVLVPKSINPNLALLDASKKIEVIVFLHGFTEDSSSRPYAGWRELNPTAGKWTRKGKEDFVHSLRHGIEPEDTAPVRDVALDQAEQQLQASGSGQTIMVLPQGGLQSQFGKGGDTDFNSDAYAAEILARLEKLKVLDTAATPDQIVGRITMAGHSGAGATLARMAKESVRRDKEARSARLGKPGKPGQPLASSALTGDLLILDAINEGQLDPFEKWALMRLDNDLEALKSLQNDAQKLEYLRTAQKLRGYYSTGKHGGTYVDRYKALQAAIDGWFKKHRGEIGPLEPRLRANFSVDNPVAVSHEELMRGVPAGQEREGGGTILDALEALHPDAIKVPAGVAP